MRELYKKLEELLAKVDFGAIAEGFGPCEFAIYNETTVYLKNRELPGNEKFFANTAIEFEDDYLAIYMVPDLAQTDAEELASMIVHEMFHVYQRKREVEQYPDDMELMRYPDDAVNFQAKYAEDQILAAAYEAGGERKAELFESFLAVRECRKKYIGDIFAQELYAEQIEGMAEYAASSALRQIAPQKFEKRMEKYLRELRETNGKLFDVRRISYITGTIYYLVWSDIGKAKTPQETVRLPKEMQGRDMLQNISALQNTYRSYVETKKQRILAFKKSAAKEQHVNGYRICGYDPMNMFRLEDWILCERFVELHAADGTATVFHEPVLLEMKEGSRETVKAAWTAGAAAE